MNLSDRQKQILGEVIKEYVRSAEPVSSNFLVEKCGLDCSPATARAEMLNLEKEGYLQQPHTSAGRVPTDKAYRFFVDYLLKEKEQDLPEKDRRVIDRTITAAPRNPHALSSGLAKTMARLTDDFAISGIVDTGEFYRFGFTNIFELPEFSARGGSAFGGEETEDIFGFGSIFDEFENYFQDFFDDFSGKEVVVRIGRENPARLNRFSRSSGPSKQSRRETVMVARYPLPDDLEGVSALIGPMRMAYDRNMALLKYVAKKMNQLK